MKNKEGRKEEERRKRDQDQPRVPQPDMPENDPDAAERWIKEQEEEGEKRRRKDTPGGVEEMDLM